MHLNFRTATLDDREPWIRMRCALYAGVADEFHEAELVKIVESSEMESFLIERDTQPIGLLEMSLRNFVDGCINTPVGYIEGIYVDPEFRNQNIGSRAVEFARQWCRDRGCSEIATDSELHEERSQRFHLKMGFKETYRIVQFRDDV